MQTDAETHCHIIKTTGEKFGVTHTISYCFEFGHWKKKWNCWNWNCVMTFSVRVWLYQNIPIDYSCHGNYSLVHVNGLFLLFKSPEYTDLEPEF